MLKKLGLKLANLGKPQKGPRAQWPHFFRNFFSRASKKVIFSQWPGHYTWLLVAGSLKKPFFAASLINTYFPFFFYINLSAGGGGAGGDKLIRRCSDFFSQPAPHNTPTCDLLFTNIVNLYYRISSSSTRCSNLFESMQTCLLLDLAW